MATEKKEKSKEKKTVKKATLSTSDKKAKTKKAEAKSLKKTNKKSTGKAEKKATNKKDSKSLLKKAAKKTVKNVEKKIATTKETKKELKKEANAVKKTEKVVIKATKKKQKNIFDENYEQDSEILENDELDDQKEVDFNFSKEKDLEKDLEKDDSIFVDDDEEPIDDDGEEKKALTGFEQDDIFKDVPIDDPVRMYLKEIGQYDLLAPEQEKKLAREKQEAQDILKSKNFEKTLKLTKEEAIKLPIDPMRSIKLTPDELKVIKTGEVAQEMLINRNLRLVVSIAKRYIGHGLSLLDLIQEGNLGLVRGIEKFNYKKGFKLSTYVTWWIRQAVSRALADQSKTIRIPVHMVETINRLNKVKKKLTTELGYEPTVKQIAKKMKLPESKVEEVMQIALDPISLDKPVGDEDDSIVADFIADQNAMSPEKYAEMEMLKEQIQDLLSQLKERERKVLILRFGIGDDRARTLEEVGKELKVTRERIRQIEDKALRKLGYKAKHLKNLVE